MGSLSGNGPIMPSLVTSGRPSRTRQMSALVPPTSIEMMSPKPAERPTDTAPTTPAAGPESTVCTGWRTQVAALVTPPSDFMMSSGACRPTPSSACAQHAHVAAHRRHHRRVERGRHRPLELAELGQHLGGERHEHARVLLGQDRLHALLVRGVGVGVQEHHRDRGHAHLGELAGEGARAGLVERAQDRAVHVEPLVHLEHALRRDRPRGLGPAVEVAVARDVVAADLEHVLEARGGHQRGGRRLALENRVGGGGGAVEDAQHVGRRRARPGPAPCGRR